MPLIKTNSDPIMTAEDWKELEANYILPVLEAWSKRYLEVEEPRILREVAAMFGETALV